MRNITIRILVWGWCDDFVIIIITSSGDEIYVFILVGLSVCLPVPVFSLSLPLSLCSFLLSPPPPPLPPTPPYRPLPLPPSLSLSLSLSLSISLSLAHIHTHTLSLSLSHSPALSQHGKLGTRNMFICWVPHITEKGSITTYIHKISLNKCSTLLTFVIFFLIQFFSERGGGGGGGDQSVKRGFNISFRNYRRYDTRHLRCYYLLQINFLCNSFHGSHIVCLIIVMQLSSVHCVRLQFR